MPVLMFHSIGCENENWYRKWLSVSTDHFESFCKYLVEYNYETLFLEEWYSDPNTSKQVVITFDDGYLDNWVYAYPILKKYNLKATIFINPEFIDESEEMRENLDAVWENTLELSQLKPLGFLNWSELREMEISGVMDIQSHSMSHNFYFHSNHIRDIYQGQAKYDWMAWIAKPEQKPYYTVEDQKNFVPYGTPIFDFGRALELRRYFPDEKLLNYSIELFSSGEDKLTIIKSLEKKLEELPGHFESDEAMEIRYRYEIFESKRLIEEKLGKKIDYFCWPGGGHNELSVSLTLEAGYKASTVSSRDPRFANNDSIGVYKRIKRFPMTSFISTPQNNHYIKSSNFLVNLFKYHEGSTFYKNIYRAKKLKLLILDKVRI